MGSCCSQLDGNTDQPKRKKGQTQNSKTQSDFQPAKKATHQTTLQRDYKFGKTLGHGSFGTVRKAYQRVSEGAEEIINKKYAIKTIQKEKVKTEMHLLRREIEILHSCDHPNIIRLYYTYEDAKYLHIIMEFCEGGELFDRIIKKQKLTEKEASMQFEKMLRAVKHLHENNISHRDIKPENFLFENQDDDSEIKLIDFGLSNKFGRQQGVMKTMVGTPYYVAPEVLKGGYGKECDIWSLGVVLYYMLSGMLPFEGPDTQDIFRKIQSQKVTFKQKIWKSVSKNAKSLIIGLLQKNPNQRITIQKALSHSWFHKATRLQNQIPLQIFENMKNFRADVKLRKEAMKIIVKNLHQEEIKELIQAFNLIDSDKTGFISAQQLKKTISDFGHNLAEEKINKILQEMNYIGSGKINYSEFVAASLNKKIYMKEEKLWEAFNFFDTDKSGYITKDDLQKAFIQNGAQFTMEEIQKMISDVDLAHDNRISFDEFKNMMDPSGLKLPAQTQEKQGNNKILPASESIESKITAITNQTKAQKNNRANEEKEAQMDRNNETQES